MKIVVNTRFLIQDKLEGIGWFTYETLKRITQNHPEHEFIFLFDRDFDEEFIFSENVKGVKLSPQARHPILWYIWFEHRVARFLKKEKPDLFLSTDGFLCLKTTVPTTLVMHDIAFEHYPQDVDKLVRNYYLKYSPKFAKKAARIATVSRYSKNDISTHYDIDPDKIDIVYNGSNEVYVPIPAKEQESVRVSYTNGSPYFLYVGALHPRKNITNLLKAFELFKEKTAGNKTKLLIVGRKGWSTAEMEETYNAMKFRDDVVFTGRLSTTELHKVLASAHALTYVPYFEGFGIPIIEAQATGTAVITSEVTSMPEVAEMGAILVNPLKPEEIAGAMYKLHTDEEFRQSLIVAGTENQQRFSWNRSAELLWESIEKTLSE